jgi:hypothetical protein
MLRKTMIALLAATSVAMLAPNVALAGFGGTGAMVMVGSNYDDGYSYCHVVRQRVHTRTGWRVRSVRVCN